MNEAQARQQERERIRTAVEALGGLEYGTSDEGTRYLNSDYVSRVRVLEVIAQFDQEPAA